MIESRSAVVGVVMWLICLVAFWKLNYDPDYLSIGMKIIISAALLPIVYIVTYLVLNK